MATLERLLGTPTMDRALRLYADRWRFRHPTTKDFIAAVNDATGSDWTWFFDRTFFSSGIVDYAVAEAATTPAKPPRGLFEKDGKLAEGAPPPRDKVRGYDSVVTVIRRGDVPMPVDVLLRFDGGHVYRSHWNDDARWKRFRVSQGPRLIEAIVDPDEKILLDADRTNNGLPAGGGPPRRDALDGARRLLGAEHDRFHDGGLVNRGGPRALACFLRGLRLSLSKPYLAVALWLIQLMLSATIILPVSNTLHALLDRSPAGQNMVAVPDYGWWETVRRVHSDVLGNFPEIAMGLLSPGGIHWSELPGMRGRRRDGVFARPARDRAARLRAGRRARRPAGAFELARDVRARGHEAHAGVSRLHVRGLRRRASPPTSGSTSARASSWPTACGTCTPSKPRWP